MPSETVSDGILLLVQPISFKVLSGMTSQTLSRLLSATDRIKGKSIMENAVDKASATAASSAITLMLL